MVQYNFVNIKKTMKVKLFFDDYQNEVVQDNTQEAG